MSFSPISRLGFATGFAHGADQLALAALPLVVTLGLGGGPGLVGLLVAVQSAAWLLVSLPAGALIDRSEKRRWMVRAQGLAALCLAAAAAAATLQLVPALGLAVLLGAGGTVAFVLSGFAAVPLLAEPAALPRANARLELARAVATLSAPVLAGVLAKAGQAPLGFALAALCALLSAVLASRLPAMPRSAAERPPLGKAIRDGASFVWRQPYLRAIALCAIVWNMGFFVLMAVFVPYALGHLGLDAAGTGLTLSAYGAGLLLGALAAPRLAGLLKTGTLLAIGPGLSVLAGFALLAGPTPYGALPFVAFFLIGFGPMIWQIGQTSLRQIVTPPDLLGRVGATLQVAVFGVRPLGALLGGWIGAGWGVETAMLLVPAGFALSLLAILASPLRRLGSLEAAVRVSG
ncbi:MFS transporter [Oceanibaculum nanhaiense]|uniref:MFS transporter n=1 Tax=Oceanibaculum nanhaiense TaxID=1909734 RepID=UPI0015948898|nr:MFS transporter [Oceanibaculum nanhaiense]MBC7136274.1 MFS transporter [Oceanibaculum nanhaiense]